MSVPVLFIQYLSPTLPRRRGQVGGLHPTVECRACRAGAPSTTSRLQPQKPAGEVSGPLAWGWRSLPRPLSGLSTNC